MGLCGVLWVCFMGDEIAEATHFYGINLMGRNLPTTFCTIYYGLQRIPPITYYWTGLLILDHSYLVGNLPNSKIAETKAYIAFKILTLSYQQFSNLLISRRDMSGPRLGALSNNRWSEGMKEEEQGSLFQQKKNGGSRDWALNFKMIDQHLSHWATRTRWFQEHQSSIMLNLQLAVNVVTDKVTDSVQTPQPDRCEACKRSLWTWCQQALVSFLFSFFPQWPK